MNVGGLAPADVLRILSRSSEFLPHFASGRRRAVVGGAADRPRPRRPTARRGSRPSPGGGGRGPVRGPAHGPHRPRPDDRRPPTAARGSRLVPAFRGWSTVVLTAGRLVGICPRGDALSGPVDFDRGTVVAWSFPLRHVDAAGVVDVGRGPMVAVRSTDRLVGGVTLEGVHRVVDGGLQPVAPEEMAATLNTAHPSPIRRPAAGVAAVDHGPGGASSPSPWS